MTRKNRKQNTLEWSFGYFLSLRCLLDIQVDMKVGTGQTMAGGITKISGEIVISSAC